MIMIDSTTAALWSNHLPCTRCKGEKTIPDILDKSRMRDCPSCGGTGEFAPINLDDLLNRIRASQGKNKGRLRASMTSPSRKDGMGAARAYYVWRMARFHGGQDVTMPIVASSCVHGDPFTDKLDAIAEHVAKLAFGTDLAGVARWARAFGMV